MARTKEYRKKGKHGGSSTVGPRVPLQRALLVFADELSEGARIARRTTVDLRDWLGRGVDEWVDSMIVGWLLMLDQGAATESVAAYYDAFKGFLEFLVSNREHPLVGQPSQLRPLHMSQFVGWLKARSQERTWGVNTTHTQYAHLKRNIVQLMKMNVVVGDPKRFFPARPFENGNKLDSRYSAFSENELSKLAKAIKADIINEHHGRLVMRPSEAITGRFLIIAMRTGGNGTPLLELSRKVSRPGLLPGTKVLSVLKYRAKKTIGLVLAGQVKEKLFLTPLDAAAVLDRTIEETEHLVSEAPPRIQDRIWLFRCATGTQGGSVSCLTYGRLNYGIETLVKRHGLLGDDGQTLHVNITRLRKSFGKRAFRLTNGDVLATANLLGNTPQITESRYLNPDAELLTEAAGFMSSELAIHMRGGATSEMVIPVLLANTSRPSSTETPVAGCKDTLQGALAPKDGLNHCDKFVMCVFCPSFAVVGELGELWRLFSFQQFAQAELDLLNASASLEEFESPERQVLRKRYQIAIPFIDTFTVSHFGAKLVQAAKEKTRAQLHPFWELQMRLVGNTLTDKNPGKSTR